MIKTKQVYTESKFSKWWKERKEIHKKNKHERYMNQKFTTKCPSCKAKISYQRKDLKIKGRSMHKVEKYYEIECSNCTHDIRFSYDMNSRI